jgi:hypothetical protein
MGIQNDEPQTRDATHWTITDSDWDRIEALLEDWRSKISSSSIAHSNSARRCTAQHYLLGIPSIALSSIVSTALFTSLSSGTMSAWVTIVVGSVSLLSALLAGLQTFLRLPERAEAHRTASAKYAAVERDIQVFLTLSRATRRDAERFLELISKQCATLGEDSPNLSRVVLQEAVKISSRGQDFAMRMFPHLIE